MAPEIKMKRFLILSILLATLSSSDAADPQFITDSYPAVVFVSEDGGTTSSDVIFTFTASDADGVNPVLSYVYSPTSAQDMFTITESNPSAGVTTAVVQLSSGETFNYETRSVYIITVNAFDGVNYAGEVILTVKVNDTGEDPTLNPNTTLQTFYINENPAGTIVGNPSFTIEDKDSLELHAWSVTGGTGASYLTVLETNGTVMLKTDYDLETAGTPTSVYVDVAITDRFGLSVTLTYSVVVSDVNDNLPVFSPTVYTFSDLNTTTPIGTTVATLTASDNDVSYPNNNFTYSLQNTNVAEYFAVNGSDVVLQYTFDMRYGTNAFSFLMYVTDGGTPAYTGTATMSITVSGSTTAATTTTILPPAGYDFSNEDSNVALMIVSSFVAAFILGYVLVLCWRFHTFRQCLPERCPRSSDCDRCCVCCLERGDFEYDEKIGDSHERATRGDFPGPPVIASKKGSPLGFEAPNSRKSPVAMPNKIKKF